ncbi:MAG: TonB-dependent receptor [Gammaproteobacteria bacterium]|nr:TonB-dependent receptor [Gammaproteobacteria bacterium]
MKYPSLRHRRLLLAALIPALLHGPAQAEQTRLGDVVVTGAALDEELNRTAVEAEELRALRPVTSDTANLLKYTPGVSLYGAGGVSSLPVIHGLGDDRLRVKVDGMDLISACGNHMNAPLSYIDPSSVERIEVFAGIAPVSAGGDSIGGAILVESAAPEFAAPGEGTLQKGEVGAFYRSNGSARGGHVAATLANESLSLNYRGSTAQADNYKAGEDFKPAGLAAAGRGWLDGDEVGSTMYKSTNQSLSLGLQRDIHLLEFKVGVQDIPYQGWPNQRMDMTRNDSTQLNLDYEGDYDWGLLEARVYQEKTRHAMQFHDDKLFWYGSNSGAPFPDGEPCVPSAGMNGCAAGMPMDTDASNRGVRVQGEIPISERDLVRIGAEAQQYRLDDWWDPSGKGMWPDTFWNIRDGERDRLALFGEWEARWNPAWLTQLGLRYERVEMDTGEVQGYNATYLADATAFNAADREKTDDNLDLAALARFTPADTRTVEFGYGRKSRSPNLYERYAWSTGGMAMRMVNWAGDGNGYVGNLDLEPEVAHTLSTSIAWHDANQTQWELKVAPYFTYVEDYIDAERCSGAMTGECTATNLTRTDGFVYLQFVDQSARLYGVDVSGHMPLGESADYGRFTATGLLNYVRGKNATTDDNLYNIMPLNARLAVVQEVRDWTNTLEVELVDAKTDVSAERNEVATGGYGLLHLRSSYEWKQLRLDLGIENVLDRFYNPPLGGAYLGQGKTMSGTGVPWGVPVPGMGRSFYAGVTVQF